MVSSFETEQLPALDMKVNVHWGHSVYNMENSALHNVIIFTSFSRMGLMQTEHFLHNVTLHS